MLLRNLRRFPHALRGLFSALANDFSFKTQVLGGLLSAGLVIWLAAPLSLTEYHFLGLGLALIFITELQNSSVEAAMDHLHPDNHSAIGLTKDLAAATVLIAGIFYAVTILLILLPRFLSMH
ncbi:diacylglycerol kinase [Patescibacteria group bacterium]|nr:diacylglycerol kinase [Patescibacteria group bacterium]